MPYFSLVANWPMLIQGYMPSKFEAVRDCKMIILSNNAIRGYWWGSVLLIWLNICGDLS